MTNTEKQPDSPQLTSKQKKFLKGLGHSLTPVVAVGKEGIGQNIINATLLELSRHELIKVKVGKNSPVDRYETAERLASESNSSLVQVLGRTILLYKENPKLEKDKRLRLPR